MKMKKQCWSAGKRPSTKRKDLDVVAKSLSGRILSAITSTEKASFPTPIFRTIRPVSSHYLKKELSR
jgi:hypothetical protein